MATALEVAAFIRAELPGPISRMKLLKLVYYAQAWALAWDGAPLFSERIEAWADGPVVRSLWAREKHGSTVPADANALTACERETVCAVLKFYAGFDGDKLSEFTHAEGPWVHAREGVPQGAASQGEISAAAMRSYYGAVKCEGKAIPDSYAKGLEYLLDLTPEARAELLAAAPDGEDYEPVDMSGEDYGRRLEAGEVDRCPPSFA